MLTHFILFQLVLYVFLYPGRVFPYRINVIPSTPKLPVTVFELQIAKLLIKHQTALSLQVPHKSRDTHLGRDLQKHMDVIHTAFCFQDIHVFPFAQFYLKYCQSLCVFPCRTPAFGTSAQKLYDIYSSIGCALSSFHPSLGPPFDFLLNICSCQTANCFNKSKGVFITDPKLKALLNPQPSWGFSGHNKKRR
ncbi:hypothetical protein DJ56_2694 [Yersinia pestis]|nr:hypothetical protein DJ56_2694 [Yersinia pestis]